MSSTGVPRSGTFDSLRQPGGISRCLTVVLITLHLLLELRAQAQDWRALGPSTFPEFPGKSDFFLKNARGIGRAGAVRFLKQADGALIRILLTPYGGMWKWNQEMLIWEVITGSDLLEGGVADLQQHPKNLSKWYAVAGDADCILDHNGPALWAEHCVSGGLFRSEDAGRSWEGPIGNWIRPDGSVDTNFWTAPSGKVARRLIIDPKRPARMCLVLHTYDYSERRYTGYVYRSLDAGANWYPVLQDTLGRLKELEYDQRAGVLYAAGSALYRSLDFGSHWTLLDHSGLPAAKTVSRMELSVGVGRSGVVDLLVVNDSLRTNQIFRSLDKGCSFSLLGNGAASPPWRTALAVHPEDPELIFFSAGNKVNRLVRSATTWRAVYAGGDLHDDVHELMFDPQGKYLLASTDGGLYATTDSGKTWSKASESVSMAECWDVAIAPDTSLRVLSGLQDCGTVLYRSDTLGGAWFIVRGGDGMGVEFDAENDSLAYHTDGNNTIVGRSGNGGINWNTCTPKGSGRGYYLTALAAHPVYPDLVLSGFHDLFISRDEGRSWTRHRVDSALDPGLTMTAVAWAPSDSLTIYVAFENPVWSDQLKQRLYKSTDGGDTWVDITSGLQSVAWMSITSLAVHPDHAEWITVGFRGGAKGKVMQNRSGGVAQRWQTVVEGLSGSNDVYALTYDWDAHRTLYAGTRRGVWHLQDNRWSDWSGGLPACMISGLAIRKSDGLLVAGTHGWGVWMGHTHR